MHSIAPPDPPAPIPSRRSIVPLVILAGAACGLIVVGILLFQWLNRPGNAEEVARDFAVAAHEADFARGCELAAPRLIDPILEAEGVADCAELAERLAADPASSAGREAADVEVLETTQEGDTASVRLSSPSGTSGVWVRVDLERIDGLWRVTDYSG